MKIKSALKYRYKKNLRLIGVFYLAFVVITFVAFMTKRLYPYSYKAYEDGVDIFYYMTAIFLIVMGFLSFKDELKFFVQNGITREQCHKSFWGYLPITIGFALAERLFTFLFCKAINVDYSHFLSTRVILENRAFIADVIYETLSLMCFLSLGYLIAIILRRIKRVYIAMGVIVIVVALFADYSLSQIDGLLPNFAYVPSLICFGSAFNEFIPLNFVISHILTVCILLSLSHILTLGMSINGKEKN